MNIVSKLKNTKNGVFALITNGIVDVLSNFKKHPITGLASIAINASMLPSIYYFYKLIKARQEGSKRVYFEKDRYDNILEIFIVLASIVVNASMLPPIYYFFKLIQARHKGSKRVYFENDRYDNILELVEAAPNPNIMDESEPITDPRKEKGVVAGKVSIYRLTCVIGSIISLAFSILSLYSFISSLRFKNQMNAWGISFALLSPLVAALTIFLQKQLVGNRLPEFIKKIGIGRLPNTTRDVNYYAKSEALIYYEKRIATTYDQQKKEIMIEIEKPYYYSFRCILSLSFTAFAQLIAVYTLPNTMRISAFVVCANLCFALSRLIFDAYYTYRCNIYDEKNRVVVMGEEIIDPDNFQPRELLQIRLAGKVSELREALKTKWDEVIKILKQKVKNNPEATTSRHRLVERATLINLALDSLNEPVNLGLGKGITDNTGIAMNIMHNTALGVGEGQRAIYSTGFNGSDPALLKADRADLTQPLKKEAYIHRFKGGKVKMEDQHLCYGLEAAAGLMMYKDGALGVCGVHHGIEKIITTSFELVILALVARQSEIASGGGANAILKTIRKVAKEAGEKEEVLDPILDPIPTFRINPESFLQHINSVENAFDFKVATVEA